MKNQINSQFKFIVYSGVNSKVVAQSLDDKLNISIFSIEDSFGLDKNKCLYLFDKVSKKKKGVMINQSLKNKQEFPYSVAIIKLNRLSSIINQISSDYFTNFDRNLSLWGFPWGDVSKVDKARNNISMLSRNNEKVIIDFSVLLKRFGVLTLDSNMLRKTITWINKSKEHQVNLFVMVCPDYSFSYDSNNNALRYDNENKLGDGIGIIADRSLEFLKAFNELTFEHKLNINIIIGIADYEDTNENLVRLGESGKTFYEKIKNSINKIKIECDKFKIPANVIPIREFFGEQKWLSQWNESEIKIKNALDNMDTGKLNRLILNRRKLYSKWYPDIKNEEVLERIIRQGTEYTNCGFLFNQIFKELLILGTNSINMDFFYRLRSENLPVLYITNIHE